MIAFDILVILVLFTLFAISHTWLASRSIKKRLAEKIGTKIAFYRIFYNVSSLLIFFSFYILAPKPDVTVYDLQFPFDIITFALQILSLGGLFWAGKNINLMEFLGITQIERYYNGEYLEEDLDEKQQLLTNGAFKIVRHPIYLFCILFLGLRPQMDLFYMIMFVCSVIYFYIGSIFEERKLVDAFGEKYKEYQNHVPRLFPFLNIK